jgi:hypothetical protein
MVSTESSNDSIQLLSERRRRVSTQGDKLAEPRNMMYLIPTIAVPHLIEACVGTRNAERDQKKLLGRRVHSRSPFRGKLRIVRVIKQRRVYIAQWETRYHTREKMGAVYGYNVPLSGRGERYRARVLLAFPLDS